MPNWKNATPRDRKKLAAIEILLRNYPRRVDQIFHPREPGLKTSPEGLLRTIPARERIVVGLAYDLWGGTPRIRVADLEALEFGDFENVIEALKFLRS